MTNATISRIARLYEKTVGYDPIAEGWTPQAALATLQEYRAEGWHKF